jgi:hypothetical protein
MCSGYVFWLLGTAGSLLVGLCWHRRRSPAHRLNLDVNYRVTANLTLSTMTVLPEPRLIKLAYGVSAESSHHGRLRCADVNYPDAFLFQQSRHHLDL